MNLFDSADKIIKFNRSLSEQLQIKLVLNPFTQIFIDVQQAISLGILYNGYYRNRYGGLIPLHIAASKGFIQFTILNEQQIECEEMEIEYRSIGSSLVASLIIRQVYDQIQHRMISFRQAIENDLLDTELFLYNSTISLHEAFYRGLIVGELRTHIDPNSKFEYKQQPIRTIIEHENIDFDPLLASMNALIKSLSTFTTDTIRLLDQCELTSTGHIRHRQTGTCYLLTQAIELGLVSLSDLSSYSDNSMNISEIDDHLTRIQTEHNISLFSDTIILDRLKAKRTDESHSPTNRRLTNLGRILPLINSC